MALAKRCERLLQEPERDHEYVPRTSALVARDLYHPTKNPQGIINFGVAENMLTDNMLKEKIGNGELYLTEDPLHLYYSAAETIRIRKAMANFLTRFFRTANPVKAENLFFGTGVGGCLDTLSHCLADPGDVFLVVTPMFSRIKWALLDRGQAESRFIHLTAEMRAGEETSFQLTMERIEEAYQQALADNRNVKGVLLVNPGNPIGDVFSPELLMDLLHFCHRHSLHLVSDELYAMSVHDPDTEFHSVLSIPNLPDPHRTHVLYGMSKDFGLTKFRLGVIHTSNPGLKNCLSQLRFFNFIPLPIMEATSRMLEDLDWCQDLFALSRRGMRENYLEASARLQKMGLNVRPTVASFFLWASFQPVCGPMTFEKETALYAEMFRQAKVNVWGGRQYHCSNPGWFRFLIAMPSETLKIALDRLETFVRILQQDLSVLDKSEDL